MGIKGLWGILTPYSEKKSLHEIKGEKLAIDLSGWVCDSQNVTDYHIQPKLYLRNLFFRTVYLLLADIEPIFVLEGDAPELKRDVMAARNALQFRGAAPRTEATSNKRPDVGRKRFRGVLRECENLLKCLGVICLKGLGEAEATCAQLNAQGLVDAVVSQDSDCFAYGAHRVYRNFSVSNSAGGGAVQGSIDCYDATAMYKQNGFGRNKMVALALLCGCDYGAGACGSSITTAITYLHTLSETEVINRLLSWVTDPKQYEERSRWVSIPGRCDCCGHAGRTHAKNGCPVCVTNRGCNDTGHKQKVAEIKRELSLRKRALTCGAHFPEPLVMKEFLNRPPEEFNLDKLKSSPPSLILFTKLMTHKLDWSERYCVEKFLPILTKFHLQDNVRCKTIKPIKIIKKRNPRGVPSYEVIWQDIDGQYEGLIPDDQFEDGEDHSLPWTTTQRQDLMKKYYPNLVEEFEESVKKPVKEKKPRKKKEKKIDQLTSTVNKPKRKYNRKTKKIIELEIHNLSNSINNMNISAKQSELNSSKANVSVKVNKLKRKLKPSKLQCQKTIESFINIKKKRSKLERKSLKLIFKGVMCENDEEFDIINCENEHKENPLESNLKQSIGIFEITQDEINESDLSDIVDKIVSKAPTHKTARLNNNLVHLLFGPKFSTPTKSGYKKSVLTNILNNCSTPRDSPVRRQSLYEGNISNNSFKTKPNISYFFDKLTDECDAFEMSLDYNKENINDSVSDLTVNYSLRKPSF